MGWDPMIVTLWELTVTGLHVAKISTDRLHSHNQTLSSSGRKFNVFIEMEGAHFH
jgi:hypothetical protein